MSAERDPIDDRLAAIPDEPPGEALSIDDLLAVRAAPEGHPHDARVARDPAARSALRALAEPVSAPVVDRAVAVIPRRAPARRGLWLGAGAALAMAAALAVLVQRPTPLPDAYRVASVRGGEQRVRSEVRDSALFLPRSRLRLAVVPVAEPAGAVPLVRVYVSADGGPLALGRDVRITPHDGAVQIEAEAGTLFGTQAGPKTVFVGLALEPDTLEQAVGMSPQAARGLSGVRWLEVPLTYRLVAPE